MPIDTADSVVNILKSYTIRFNSSWVKPFSIILIDQVDLIIKLVQLNIYIFGLCMFQSIIQKFLYYPIENIFTGTGPAFPVSYILIYFGLVGFNVIGYIH